MSGILKSISPTDNEVIGEIAITSEEQVKEIVSIAKKARISWGAKPVFERLEALRSISTGFKKRKDDFVHLMATEVGILKQSAIGEFDFGMWYFDWYLSNSETLLEKQVTFEDEKQQDFLVQQPLGIAAVVTPWNFPFGIGIWGIIPNLIVGNTVVFKHSEECPLIGKVIEEVFSDSSVPEGVFSEVYGASDVGETLVDQDIDLIWFTGSSKVGHKLYQKAADKFIRVVLELGGSSPGIVFKDADLENNIDHVFNGRFYKCGQICEGIKRLIVHKDIKDEVVSRLSTIIKDIKLGDPLLEDTTMGPLVAERQVELLESQINDAKDKGAEIIANGKVPDDLTGAFYYPAIVTNISPDMRIWNEEVFGPVLPIVTFETEEEAIKLANDTEYGLGGNIFTEDKELAERVALKVDTGMLSVNGASYGKPVNPFGGFKRSGLGRGHGQHPFADLSNLKLVATSK